MLLAGLVVGSLAGSYPALILSSFQPVVSLKGGVKSHGSGTRLRQGLVVAQFAISILLLTGMLMIGRQLEYMRTKNLGFDSSHALMVNVSAVKALGWESPAAALANPVEALRYE